MTPNHTYNGLFKLALSMLVGIGATMVASKSTQADWYPDASKGADPHEDPSSPLGNDTMSCSMGESGGPALHVTYATGNVWTTVPILTTYGEGEVALGISLTYNSLFSDTDDGLGAGWILGITGSAGGGATPQVIPLYYTEIPAETSQAPGSPCGYICPPEEPCFPNCPGYTGPPVLIDCENNCYPSPGDPDCPASCPLDRPNDNPPYYSPRCQSCPSWNVVTLPGKVIITDSEGKKSCYYKYVAGYGSNYWDNPDFDHVSPLFPPQGRGENTLYDLYPDPNYSFKLVAPDGTAYFFKADNSTSGVLAKIVSPRGREMIFNYISPGVKGLTSISDGFGRTVQFVRDGPLGNLSKIIHPISSEETILNYTTDGAELISVTDPMNYSIQFEYELVGNFHRITQETLKNDRTFKCSYADYTGPPMAPAGQTWQGRTLSAVKNATEEDILLTVAAKNFASGHGPLTFVSVTESQVFNVRNGKSDIWQYTRNEYGRITRKYHPLSGYLSTLDFNNLHQESDLTTFRRISSFSPHPFLRREFTWTTDGRLTQEKNIVTVPNASTEELITTYGYATEPPPPNFPWGLPISKTLPNGGVWLYSYNTYGDPKITQDPLNQLTSNSYEFDASGRLLQRTETNRRGFDTISTYTNPGELNEELIEFADQQYLRTTYTYDLMGRRLTETRFRGDSTYITTKYEYDAMGRTTKIVENYVDNGPSTETQNLTTLYEYDGHGLLLSVTNPMGVKTKYEYDHRNWLIRKTEDEGTGEECLNLVTEYERDGNGNIAKLTDAEGRETIYSYDAADHLVSITDAEGYNTTLKRDGGGRIIELRRQRSTSDNVDNPSGQGYNDTLVYEAGYDGLGRMRSYSVPGLYTRTYDYSNWSSGGSCSCAGLGSDHPRKIVSTVPGEAWHTFNEVDVLGRLKKVIRKANGEDPSEETNDAVTRYEYDEEGNLTEIHGPEGEFTSLLYDGSDRLTKRTVRVGVSASAQDLVTEYEYNAVGSVTSVLLPTNKALTYQYDPADRLSAVLDGETPLAAFEYDSNGNRTTHTDGANNTWVYEYDRADRLQVLKDPIIESPEDRVTTYAYDTVGNLVHTVNNNGVKTCYLYDDLNRLRCTIEDCDEATMGSGDDHGQLDGEAQSGTQSENPEGGEGGAQVSTGTSNTWTCNIYDGRFLVGLEDHDYNRTLYEYDRAGRITDVYFPGTTPQTGMDHVRYEYLANPYAIIKRIDQRGISTLYELDLLGRLYRRRYLSQQGGSIRTEYFTFDRSHRLQATMDGQQNLTWARTYDSAGRTIGESQFFSTEEAFVLGAAYDLDTAGQSMTHTLCYPPGNTCPNSSGRSVSRAYDARFRLNSVSSDAVLGETWTFDEADRRSSALRANGFKDSFDYDENSRLTGIAHYQVPGEGDPTLLGTIYYKYDPFGNRTSTRRTSESGQQVIGPANRSEIYKYDNRNRLTGMDRGSLNEAGTEVSTILASGDLFGKLQWTDLDHRGNWLDYRERLNGVSKKRIAEADGVNQYTCLSTQLGPVGTTPCTSQPSHDTPEYDPAGNMTYNPLGRVIGDASCWPSTGVPGCPSGHDYVYDGENRLVAIYQDTDNSTTPDNDYDGEPDGQPPLLKFRYDALGRRVETIEYVNPETGMPYVDEYNTATPRRTRHVYHGLEVVQEYHCCDGEAGACGAEIPSCGDNWQLARELVWGDGNRFPEPIAMVDYTNPSPACEQGGSGCTYHYLRDVLGSVVGLTNASGALVERYTYDPYGRTLIESRDPVTGDYEVRNASAFGNPWMWTGQRYDAATGTYHFLFRTYSPTLGRWLQRDPIGYAGGSMNLYEYVMSAPMNLIDPLGLAPPKEKSLKDAFGETCEKECTAQCNKKSSTSKPTSQGSASCSKPEDSPKTEKECKDDCLKECNAEADKIIKAIEEQIERCKTQGSKPGGKPAVCNIWSSRLRWLLRRMKPQFFKFEAIKMTPMIPHSGHVVFGIRGISDNGQFEGHDVWDFVIDITRWNDNNYGGELYGFEGGTGEIHGPNKIHRGSFRPVGPPLAKNPGEDTPDGPFPDRFPPP